MFYTYYVIFSEILTHFLALNFKTKVLTAQKKSSFRMSGRANISIAALQVAVLWGN